ncbi:MAG: OsmC family protein [Anaerolineae bacterium]|nr:OsmC family protein [Anaerolineae bacterium]
MVGQTDRSPRVILDNVMDGEERVLEGPSPMEYLLLGLAGCTGMDVVSILQKKRQPFTNLEVRVTAERADEHPRVYTKVHMTFVVTGKDVKPEAVERAIELSETKYCSASAMFAKTAEMSTSYEIVEA